MRMFILLVLWHCSVLHAVQLLKNSQEDVRKVFKEYETEFDRKYRGREERERFKVFRKRFIEVKKHNEQKASDYYMEINKFSDMKNEELSSYLGMENMTDLLTDLEYIKEEDEEINMSKRETVPLEVDHTANGIVTPVKNQHACGSCWTFSAVGAFEAAYKQVTGYLKSFSEQELLDCYYGDTYDSCNGGYHYKPFYYINYYKRLATYNDYPYIAKDGPCDKTKLPENGIKNVKFTGFKLVPSDDVSVEKALSKHVLAVAVHASTMFYYRSGLFTGCPRVGRSTKIDHAMVMTGYTQTYWTLKNSWGSDWGENGYIRVSRDLSQNTCQITRAPVYPEMFFDDKGETDANDLYAEKDDDDVALTGNASQSTTADLIGTADHAIDGDTNGNYSQGSCSKTNADYISWWRAELEYPRTIKRIVLNLRSDNDTSLLDINGATLHVGDRGDYKDPQCDSVLDASEHEDYTLTRTCSKLVGKFVTVDYYHPRKPLRPLTLCEVQIYAHDEDDHCKAGNIKCDDGLCKPASFC